jgi:hypothetical protein
MASGMVKNGRHRFAMVSLRTEAESVAIALEIRILSVDDAVNWAICQLDELDMPPVAICDAAMAGSKYPQDVVMTLREVPGDFDRSQAVRLVLRYALDALEQGKRNPIQVTYALYDLAHAGDLSESELDKHQWHFWDHALYFICKGESNRTEEQFFTDWSLELKGFLRSRTEDAHG